MKRLTLRILGLFVLLMISQALSGQDVPSRRSYFLSGSFMQIKDAVNYGLVFRGPAVDFGMEWEFPVGKQVLGYGFQAGAGFMFAKEIAAIDFCVRPVDLSWSWVIPAGKSVFRAGPALRTQYDLQFYPDLQSGYDFWLTDYAVGIRVAWMLPSEIGTFRVRLYQSVAGLVSQTPDYTDPYFYDITFGEIVTDMHSGFEPVSFGRFCNTTAEFTYRFRNHPRLALSYVLDYVSCSTSQRFRMLNQSVRVIIYSKS